MNESGEQNSMANLQEVKANQPTEGVESSVGEYKAPEKTEQEEELEGEMKKLLGEFKTAEADLIGKTGMIKGGEKRQDIPIQDENGNPQLDENNKVVRGFPEDAYRDLLAKRNELWSQITDLESRRIDEQMKSKDGYVTGSDKLSREIESLSGYPADILKAEDWEKGKDHSDYEGYGGTDTAGGPVNTNEYYADQGYELRESRDDGLYVRKSPTN